MKYQKKVFAVPVVDDLELLGLAGLVLLPLLHLLDARTRLLRCNLQNR